MGQPNVAKSAGVAIALLQDRLQGLEPGNNRRVGNPASFKQPGYPV